MVKYVKANSDNYLDKYWDEDYDLVYAVYPIFEEDFLDHCDKPTQSRIIATVRRVAGVDGKDMSIKDAILQEYTTQDSPEDEIKEYPCLDNHYSHPPETSEVLAEMIKDAYDYEERKGGNEWDFEYLYNLYKVMYGTEMPLM